MLAEITDDGFFFQAINRTGVTRRRGRRCERSLLRTRRTVGDLLHLGLEHAHPFGDRRARAPPSMPVG